MCTSARENSTKNAGGWGGEVGGVEQGLGCDVPERDGELHQERRWVGWWWWEAGVDKVGSTGRGGMQGLGCDALT